MSGDMEERIPEEKLHQVYRRFCARLASNIIKGIAQANITMDVMDQRLGKRKGYTSRYINGLINGKVTKMKELTDIAYALGGELEVTFSPVTINFPSIRHATSITEFNRDDFAYMKDGKSDKPLPNEYDVVEIMDDNTTLHITVAGTVDWRKVICWRKVELRPPQ